MYLEIIRGESKGFSTFDIALELEKSVYKFTPEEKEIVNEMKVVYTPELEKVQNEFVERYREATVNFSGRYGKKLQDFYKDKGSSPITMTMAMAVDYLTGQGVEFTNEEKEYLDAEKKYHENTLVQVVNAFNTKNKEKLIKFNNGHGHLMTLLQAEDMISKTNENIQKLFNLPSGFAADVMVSQNFCRPVVSQMIPVAPEKLKQVQDRIKDPFIVSYLAIKYNETNAKIEANKKQKGVIVNEIPKAGSQKQKSLASFLLVRLLFLFL